MLQGEEGVREVLQILNDEFRLSMALSGKTRDAKLMFFFCVEKLISKYCVLIYLNNNVCLPHPGCRNVAEINRNLIQFSKL